MIIANVKPKPGMIHQMQKKYNIDLSSTFFVGDTMADVQAAMAAGCKPLLVLTQKGELAVEKYPELLMIPNFPDLAAATDYVLAMQGKKA